MGPTFDILPPMKERKNPALGQRKGYADPRVACMSMDILRPLAAPRAPKTIKGEAFTDAQEKKLAGYAAAGSLDCLPTMVRKQIAGAIELLPEKGRDCNSRTDSRSDRTLSLVALEEDSKPETPDDEFCRASELSETSSSEDSPTLNRYQQDLITQLEAERVLVIRAWESYGKAQIPEKTAAVCVLTPIPSTVDAQDLVEDIVGRKLSIPILVLLMRPTKPSAPKREVLLEETTKFIDLGADDVVLQPVSEDPAMYIDMWLVRVVARKGLNSEARKKSKENEEEIDRVIDMASEREDALFWEQLHNFLDGLPRLNPRLHEPEIGKTLASCHRVIEPINSGAFSNVFLVQNSKQEFQAMKAVKKAKLSRFDLVKCISNEVQILRRLRHQNVARFYGAAQSREHIIILMELVGRENLFTFLKQTDTGERNDLEHSQAQDMFLQMSRAIGYCHEHMVSHRDIKPENFAVGDDGNRITIKLVDFGMADDLAAPLKYKGTMPFIAPEVIEEDVAVYTASAADMWSMGVVLLEMLCGLHALPRILKWKRSMTSDKVHAKDLRGLMSTPGRLRTAVCERLRPQFKLLQPLDDVLHGMLSLPIGCRWAAFNVLTCTWLNAPEQ